MLDQQYHVRVDGKVDVKLLKISSDLLKLIQNGNVPELSITDDKILHLGDQDIQLNTHEEKIGTRVFSSKEKTFRQQGMVTKKLAMPPTIDASKFKNALKREEKSKLERSAVFLDNLDIKNQSKKKVVQKIRKSIVPAPISTPVPVQPKMRDQKLRTMLIHFLASGPKHVHECVSKSGRSEKLVLEELKLVILYNEIGTPQTLNPNSYQLQLESYKELDPWQYPLYTPVERDLAIKNAIIAFDTMGLPKDASERQRMISKYDTKPKKKVISPTIKKISPVESKKTIEKVAPKDSPKESKNDIKKSISLDSKKDKVLLKKSVSDKPIDDVFSKLSEKPLPKLILKKPISPSSDKNSIQSSPATSIKSDKQTTPIKRKAEDGAVSDAVSDLKKQKVDIKPKTMDSPSDIKSLIKTPQRDPLGPSEWSKMDIPQLERYYTWVHKRNCKLQNRLTEFGDIALQIQKNCQPKVQELDRMTTIRKTLIRSGIKTDPIHFLGDFSKSVDEFKIVSAEKSAFENWVKSNGGHVRML